MRPQNTTVTVKATGQAVDSRFHRQVLAARSGHEQTPAGPHPHLAAAPTERKQTGRRFGPPPRKEPHARMQAPKPMDNTLRQEIYLSSPGFSRWVTPRQHRQLCRMGLRHGDLSVAPNPLGKGRRTPKRREASR